MGTKNILLLGGLGLGAYLLLSGPKAPPGLPTGSQYIKPGQSWNGYYNASGAPVWATATGVAFNAAGQILSNLPWAQWFPNNNNGGPAPTGNGNPDWAGANDIVDFSPGEIGSHMVGCI